MSEVTGMELTKGSKTRLEILEDTKFGDGGVSIANLAQAKVWANEIAQSGMAPKGMDTEGKVLLALQTGTELGFSPMRALQAVVVVNGRATLMGEAALGLIRSSGQLVPGTLSVGCRETTEAEKLAGEGELIGFCRSQRKGDADSEETTFSILDAKNAGLWKKTGPWTQYPKRMLQWRAVAFHMRDYWSDIGNGLMLNDEAEDLRPSVRDVTPTHETKPPAAPDPLFSARPDPDVLDVEPIEAGGKTAEALDDREGFVAGDEPEEEDEYDPETGELIPPMRDLFGSES